MKQKSILTTVLGLLLILALVGCGDNSNQGSGEEETLETEPVAMVNGEEISRSEFELNLQSYVTSYEQQGIDLESQEGKEIVANGELEVLDKLISQKVLIQAAQKDGYEASSSMVADQLESIKSQFADEEDFHEAVQLNGLTIDQLEKNLENQLVIEQYTTDKIGIVTVTEDEIKDVYEQYTTTSEEEVADYEEIKPQLEQYITQEKEQEMLSKLVEQLKNESTIDILI